MALNPHNRKPLKVLAGAGRPSPSCLLGLLFGGQHLGLRRSGRRSSASTSRAAPRWCSSRCSWHQQGLQRAAQPGARHHRAARRRQRRRGSRGHHPRRPQHRREHARAADQGHRGGHPQVLADALPPRARRGCRDAPAARRQPRPSGTATGKPTGSATPSKAPVPTATGATTTAAKSGLPQALLRSTTAPTPAATHGRGDLDARCHGHREPDQAAAGQAGERQRPGVGHRGHRGPVPGARLLQAGRRSTRSSTTPPSRWSPAPTTALEKFILGPVEVRGDEIKDAVAGLPARCPTASRRAPSRSSCPSIGSGTKALRRRHASAWSASRSPRNRFAVTLDSQGARPRRPPRRRSSTARPRSPAASPSSAPATWPTSSSSAPCRMSFTLQTRENISPTLGGEQLRLRPDRRHHRPAPRRRLLAVPVPRPRPRHRRLDRHRRRDSPTSA